jgi:hypothetical protein
MKNEQWYEYEEVGRSSGRGSGGGSGSVLDQILDGGRGGVEVRGEMRGHGFVLGSAEHERWRREEGLGPWAPGADHMAGVRKTETVVTLAVIVGLPVLLILGRC